MFQLNTRRVSRKKANEVLFFKTWLKPISVSCVRGGKRTRMKGLLNLCVTLLLFIAEVFEDFSARLWRGTVNLPPSFFISLFALLSPQQFCSFHCHLLPTMLRSVSLQLCLPSVFSSPDQLFPTSTYNLVCPIYIFFLCYSFVFLSEITTFLLVTRLPGEMAEASRLNEPQYPWAWKLRCL